MLYIFAWPRPSLILLSDPLPTPPNNTHKEHSGRQTGLNTLINSSCRHHAWLVKHAPLFLLIEPLTLNWHVVVFICIAWLVE